MFGKFLCRVGLHQWRFSVFNLSYPPPVGMPVRQRCGRCDERRDIIYQGEALKADWGFKDDG